MLDPELDRLRAANDEARRELLEAIRSDGGTLGDRTRVNLARCRAVKAHAALLRYEARRADGPRRRAGG